MEDVIQLFRKQLFEAFYDWVQLNRAAIGEKWYAQLVKKGKDAEDEADTALKVMATAMWMFNMIANSGVMAGIGPNSVSVHEIDPSLDEKSTRRLLHLLSSAMTLQYLPKDVASKPIAIISKKKFSLKLWLKSKH